MTIRARLFFGFSILLLILVGTSIFVIDKLSESNFRLQKIVDETAKRVNLSNEILINLLEATRHEKNLILEMSPEKMGYFQERFNTATESVDERIFQLDGIMDDEGRKLLEEFKTTWKEFKIYLDEIVSLALKNNNEKAFALSAGRGRLLRDLASKQIAKIVERSQKSMEAERQRNIKDYEYTFSVLVFVVIFSASAVVLIAYWIVRSITERIRFMAGEAELIAGRGSMDRKLEDPTKDELRAIFDSLVNINESFKEVAHNASIVASGNYSVDLLPRSENDILGISLTKMTQALRLTTSENERHNWLTQGQNQLNEKLKGDQSIEALAQEVVNFLGEYLKAQIGAIYLLDERDKYLRLSGEYAFSGGKAANKFSLKEGLIGQAAFDQKTILLTDLKEDQIRIVSSILDTKPANILVLPFLFEGQTLGVIEIGKLDQFTELEVEFSKNCMENIGISVYSAIARKKIQELLEETQAQGEELQSQQEELKQMNEELEEQTQVLKQQQEELRITNEELEEQTQTLEVKNREVEAARSDIEQKSKQLEVSSKYKSEFLANMSHELRTPLNSLLILSKDLSENSKKNLNSDQVESANIIYKSGQDLLVLINEVLDLSKIESGKMQINIEKVSIRELMDSLLRDFKHQADKKQLSLVSVISSDSPEYIFTDPLRLNQILKNLLSNSLKFTEKGKISLEVRPEGYQKILISVSDTGIGIPEEKQMSIFEAFQQADGSTSRKYGGTGLGLSISRELAKILGGYINLESKINQGSTFSLFIPLDIKKENVTSASYLEKVSPVLEEKSPSALRENRFIDSPNAEDDRNTISENDKVVLVIEDDLKFASVLIKQAHDKDFKCLSASTGEDGLVLAEKYLPSAVILDLNLPGINGHTVLNELKSNPKVRHIPVHVISGNEYSIEPIKEGAVEYLVKPVNKKELEEAFNRIENFINRKMKNLLIIEDDDSSRIAMRKLIGNGDVKCFEASNGRDAIKAYQENYFDCIVLDIGLPDMSGFELIYELEKIKGQTMPPIIIYTGKELTREENAELQKYAESIIIKGVKSEERLLDETALFLHRTISKLPEGKQKIINNLYDKEAIFQKKKVLVVDDDMRNVFALSKILKDRGMEVFKADNGKTALTSLDSRQDMDIVLMDIMMPEMDGYETMKRIRSDKKYDKLPIIALTAKAMKDDRQKCIDAGANDYISKPVDVERLLSLMRVWLSR
ncbi:response regulator [Leptospira dzoumogneensis]|uniref:histidine kinase n=1 Tax=Leptospira dzoumogneensis TaxID=2484904 RepID=A0A4Z1ACD3_9LEPT|nr:response regulator [Leptospira dzoumogneensis]TGM98957.1 response regulator [Leptospira dzoumogneensis]